jgi:hypothetical protein
LRERKGRSVAFFGQVTSRILPIAFGRGSAYSKILAVSHDTVCRSRSAHRRRGGVCCHYGRRADATIWDRAGLLSRRTSFSRREPGCAGELPCDVPGSLTSPQRASFPRPSLCVHRHGNPTSSDSRVRSSRFQTNRKEAQDGFQRACLTSWKLRRKRWSRADGGRGAISSTNAGGAVDRARRGLAAGAFATRFADSTNRFSLPYSKCKALAVWKIPCSRASSTAAAHRRSGIGKRPVCALRHCSKRR